MSADNGIYILQSLDGYRVIHAQAIENLYYWETSTCCSNPVPIIDEYKNERCRECGSYLPKMEQRDSICPNRLKEYFGECEVFKTEEKALQEAERIYDEIIDDFYCPIIEYGINFIRGWKDKFFPE
jgi:hypothetical protein